MNRHSQRLVNARSVARALRPAAIETLEGRQLMSAAISGNVFNDLNVAGVFKSGDPELAHVRVYVDAAATGSYQAGDPSAMTDVHGNYTISGLSAGTKTVREVLLTGFRQSLPSNGAARTVVLANGSSHATGVNFGQTQKGHIAGHVYEDFSKDGTQQSGEPFLANAIVYTSTVGGGGYVAGDQTAVTNSAGYYVLGDLTPGKFYYVNILLNGTKAGPYAGWVISQPTSGSSYGPPIADGQTIDNLNFGIHPAASLTYNSILSTTSVIANSNNKTTSHANTGYNYQNLSATGSSSAVVATSQLTSDVESNGLWATGSLSTTGFTNVDSAFSAVDVTFTLATPTVFSTNYYISGDGFYFALKDLTTNTNVIAPMKADINNPHFSYNFSTGGILAPGKYQFLFSNNNVGGAALQSLGFRMAFSL